MITQFVQETLDLIGIFAFALSGAVLGVRREFDVVGMAVLATVTAVGGGLIRDVLLDASPPAALVNPWWLLLPLVATGLTFFFHPQVQRMRRAVLVFDAVGLGVFCATGTVKAAEHGVHPVAAVLVGSLTGVGGGLVRDVLAGVTPSVLHRNSRLYAVPAIAGCAAVALAAEFGTVSIWVQAAAAAGICGLRLLALWRGWVAPVARRRTTGG
jgi:uncharacterized membrane protein YeiH